MARGAILIIHLIIASSGNVLITFALWYKFQPVGNTGRRILCMMGNEQQLSLSGELIHPQNGVPVGGSAGPTLAAAHPESTLSDV